MNSILAIQLKRLGDLILTTPALARLRQSHPNTRITLLIDDYCRELAPAIPAVDQIWHYHRKSSFSLWMTLLRSTFDLTLDFTGNDRSALITVVSKAPRRLGFRANTRHTLRTLAYNQRVSSPVKERHTVDHYLDLVEAMPGGGAVKADKEFAVPRLSIPESEALAAARMRQAIGIGAKYFVIHPGSARREKCWPAERWAEVVHFVWQRRGLPCVITGGADRTELKHVGEIQQRLSSDVPCFTLAGRVNFLIALALIAEAQFFLGVDTAAAHAAGVFQRPAVVLFGPTNPFHWFGRQPFGRVVRAGFPFPYRPEDPHQKGLPMTSLSTQTVVDAIEGLFRDLSDPIRPLEPPA